MDGVLQHLQDRVGQIHRCGVSKLAIEDGNAVAFDQGFRSDGSKHIDPFFRCPPDEELELQVRERRNGEDVLMATSTKHVYMLWRRLSEETVEYCRAYESRPTGHEQNLALIVIPYHDVKEFSKANL